MMGTMRAKTERAGPDLSACHSNPSMTVITAAVSETLMAVLDLFSEVFVVARRQQRRDEQLLHDVAVPDGKVLRQEPLPLNRLRRNILEQNLRFMHRYQVKKSKPSPPRHFIPGPWLFSPADYLRIGQTHEERRCSRLRTHRRSKIPPPSAFAYGGLWTRLIASESGRLLSVSITEAELSADVPSSSRVVTAG